VLARLVALPAASLAASTDLESRHVEKGNEWLERKKEREAETASHPTMRHLKQLE
jgi:hypothetical protein